MGHGDGEVSPWGVTERCVIAELPIAASFRATCASWFSPERGAWHLLPCSHQSWLRDALEGTGFLALPAPILLDPWAKKKQEQAFGDQIPVEGVKVGHCQCPMGQALGTANARSAWGPQKHSRLGRDLPLPPPCNWEHACPFHPSLAPVSLAGFQVIV